MRDALADKGYVPPRTGIAHAPPRDVRPASRTTAAPIYYDWRTAVRAYDYRDETGAVRAQVRRYVTADGQKDFRPWTADPDSPTGFRLRLDDDARVLYRLDDLARHPDSTVWLVEGEKDADNLADLGLVATTTQGGSNGWERHAARYVCDLTDRHVVILPDNDDAGEAYASAAARSLAPVAASVRIVRLCDDWPDLPPAGDVSDWLDLDAGRDVGRLHELADAAPDYVGSELTLPSATQAEAAEHPPASPETESETVYGPITPTPRPEGPLKLHAGADGYALTDLGNAERLIARAEGRIAWHHAAEEWLVWNGIVWETDTSGHVERLASAMARALWLAAAVAETGDEARRALRQHAARTEGKRAISDAMALARNRPGAYVPPDVLDVNPNVIAVKRGIVDLTTGVLRPADPSAWLTKAVRHPDGHGRLVIADYVPDQTPVTHPLWETFLERVVPDAEVRAYLRRAIGLSLSGWTRDAIHVHVGSGANGKSTFLDTVRRAIGPDYAHVASLDVLMARKAEAGAPNPAVADLRGKRLVIASEAEASDRLAEGTVKAITSQGEAITARRLHANPITFTPSHTLHLHSNHRPVVRGTDEGIWRRVHLIPLTETIPEAERDEGLKARLQAPEVLLGVLAWAIEGAREVAATGLCPPEAVRAATAAYRAESDVFGQWLEERCVITPDAVAGGGALHTDYRTWCEANGHRALASNQFADRLRGTSGLERGIGGNRRKWRGIGLADQSRDGP